LLLDYAAYCLLGNEINKSAWQKHGDDGRNKNQTDLVSCALSMKAEPQNEPDNDRGDCPDAELDHICWAVYLSARVSWPKRGWRRMGHFPKIRLPGS
jgi:hypothetical protein